MADKLPIIVITGTPGTGELFARHSSILTERDTPSGKSTHAELLVTCSPVPLRHINVGELVKEKGLHSGYDEEWQSYIVDEDKVLKCKTLLQVLIGFAGDRRVGGIGGEGRTHSGLAHVRRIP